MFRRKFRTVLPLLVLTLPAWTAARAAVFIPTTLTDSADGDCDSHCSLRDAIQAANASEGPDFILLKTGTYTLSLAGAGEDLGATGDLDIRDDVTIVGRDAINTVIDGGALDRVFDVQSGSKLELVDLAVTNGRTVEGSGSGIRVLGELAMTRGVVFRNHAQSGSGGGIYGQGTGSKVSLVQSTVWGNTATVNGGGLSIEGLVEVVNSTLSSNTAAGLGGGLYATSQSDSDGEVLNSTITDNIAFQGGGVYVVSDPFISVTHPTFENSIIARNGTNTGVEGDCSGYASSGGHNLLGIGSAGLGTGCGDFNVSKGDILGTVAAPVNPLLAPLAAVGGTTPVHVPSAGSPALNHGSGCEPVDQRGAERAAACDIGSVELSALCLNGGGTLCLDEGRFKVEVAWNTKDGTGFGTAVPLTDLSGYFWFFNPANVELTIKVLDACTVNNRYWIFLSGLTNVGVQVTVTDLKTGTVKTYLNPRNHTIDTVLDTNAMAVCP
ncbi:MAG: CSLREA domain-containing protein [Acidobacteriota bacterium]